MSAINHELKAIKYGCIMKLEEEKWLDNDRGAKANIVFMGERGGARIQVSWLVHSLGIVKSEISYVYFFKFQIKDYIWIVLEVLRSKGWKTCNTFV